MKQSTLLIGAIVVVSFVIALMVVRMGVDDAIRRALLEHDGARGNHEVHETYARTADGVLVLVETWHDLRIDPDKWNLPVVVVTAVRSAAADFTVDSIVNHHEEFTQAIIREATYLVGSTNIRIVVNTVSWECPGEPRPLCMTEQ